jgi:hypothetical protein
MKMPREAMVNWLGAKIPDLIIEPEDNYNFDIVGTVNGNGAKSLYTLDVNQSWVGEWPKNWKYIYIPVSVKQLIDEWKKIYKDDLYTFIIFRKDLKKAWHIPADMVEYSKVVNETYKVSILDAYQVDMNDGNSSS